jgi:leader peptidase (prepilin peptidase)/N-methyltransferase
MRTAAATAPNWGGPPHDGASRPAGILLSMGPGLAVAALLATGLGPWLPSVARRFCISSPRFGTGSRILAAVALAALLAVIAVRLAPGLLALGAAALAVAGVVLSLIDLAEHRLPDAVVWPTAAVVLLLLVAASLLEGRPNAAIATLAGAVALFAVYLVLALITPRGIGMGDVKLAAACGAALGCFGLKAWLLGLAAGFLINGAAAVAALLLRRTTLRGSLPFGPSMIAGVFVALALS